MFWSTETAEAPLHAVAAWRMREYTGFISNTDTDFVKQLSTD